MKATLSLGKEKAAPIEAPKPSTDPVFDPEENTAEMYTPEGMRYIQLKHLFNRAKQYMGPAPENCWLQPMTPEQKRNLKIQTEKNKKFFGSAKPNIKEAGLPQKVLDAERENARARAAESQAA